MQLRRTRAKQSELRFSFNLKVRTAALGLLLARWGLSWAASGRGFVPADEGTVRTVVVTRRS